MRPPSKRRRLESWSFGAITKQEHLGSGFDYKRFKTLLLKWVITDSISFQKVESDHFRRLLAFVGSSVRLEDHIPSRYIVTDNASNNTTCLKFLSEEFGFIRPDYHIRCAGHVLNLVAKAILIGSDVDAFESDLEDLRFEDHELNKWREKGPTGTLHNVVKYITGSPQHIEAFEDIQRKNNMDSEGDTVLKFIKDNFTRWNSFDDRAERANTLRACVDDFIEEERDKWS